MQTLKKLFRLSNTIGLFLMSNAVAGPIFDNAEIEGALTLSGETASRACYLDASKVVRASSVTSTELGYLSGVTSAVQTQLNAKQAGPLTGDVTTSGAAATLANSGVTAGSYTNTNLTVDAKGRITAASNGSAGGVTSINSLTGALTLTSGTSGTDFAVNSSGATITLNLPTASATNRGALSSADWNTFNGKESALTFSTGLTRSSNTITANLSTGVSGGQTAYGGTAASNSLTLRSTTNSTRGNVFIDTTSGGFAFRDYVANIPAMYNGANTTVGSDSFILASFGTTSMFYGSGGAASLYQYVGGGNRTQLTSSFYNIGVNTRIGATLGTTPSSVLEVRKDALGTTQTTSSGLALTNTTAAAAGAQQISPALRFSSNGWGTTAGTSQDVSFRMYSLPVQGATPTGLLKFDGSIAGGAYTDLMSLNSVGTLFLGSSGTTAIGPGNIAGGAETNGGGAIRYVGLAGATGNSYLHFFTNGSSRVAVSGENGLINLGENFAPTSGTANYSSLYIAPTINQTGGASGATRGIYINPTLTSAADFRAIEVASGTVVLPKTITASGTTGAQTINKITGSVNFAASASTLVVTNSLVNTNSIVQCQVEGTDATLTSCRITLGSGSFTITGNAPATAETKVNFVVLN